MQMLLDRLIRWCSDPSSEDIMDLISPEVSITEFSGHPSNYALFCERTKEDRKLNHSNCDIKLVETAISEKNTTIIYESTDELTGLRYRFCFFASMQGGRIVKIIEMCEDISMFYRNSISR